LGSEVTLLLAYQDDRPIAGTFNLVKDGVFYGRYWGSESQMRFLHFEVCCYAPVALAIREGWSRIEPGAGGQHKWGRGFLPNIIRSAHQIILPGFEDAITGFLDVERRELAQFLEASKAWVMK
jgi:predicted N-acyltransferase